MTAERDKCGLSSLLPMSCRGRAEAFARRLHSRLKSLGSQDGGNGVADEHSWLGAHDPSVSVSQPRHSSDSEFFLDFGLLESPGSPVEEITQPVFADVINNKDDLPGQEACQCLSVKGLAKTRVPSNDSDSSSDGTYYDLDTDSERLTNGETVNGNGLAERSPDESSEKDHLLNNNDVFKSPLSSECNGVLKSASYSDESTLSFPDEDYSSLEVPELSASEKVEEARERVVNGVDCVDFAKTNGEVVGVNGDVYCSHLNIEKDLTVEYPLVSEVTFVPTIELTLIDLPKDTVDESTSTENDTIELNKEHTKVEPTVTEVNCTGDVEQTKLDSTLTEVNSNEDEEQIKAELKQERELSTEDYYDSEPEERPRVRRCSSLKTGKTPPGTPGRKKIVRFADVLGLDLADVRTFLDEIPKIPNSAYEDLKDADLNDSSADTPVDATGISLISGPRPEKMLMPLFQQPGGLPNFLDRVRDQQVCVENAVVSDPSILAISGTVRVRNLDFNKSVHIRYTLDSWKTYADLQATYVQNSCDGFSDKFSFVLYANNLPVGQRIEFAARFHCRGCLYWDNNNGANYCFQCLPTTPRNSITPIAATNDDWRASFY